MSKESVVNALDAVVALNRLSDEELRTLATAINPDISCRLVGAFGRPVGTVVKQIRELCYRELNPNLTVISGAPALARVILELLDGSDPVARHFGGCAINETGRCTCSRGAE